VYVLPSAFTNSITLSFLPISYTQRAFADGYACALPPGIVREKLSDIYFIMIPHIQSTLNNLEEAHMRNRQLNARWVYEMGKKDNVIEFVKADGKTYTKINDYNKLRVLFGQLLREIQRIKSEGILTAVRTW